MTPFVVPFTKTFAPITPSFDSSVICPFTTLDCCTSSTAACNDRKGIIINRAKANKLNCHLFFIRYYIKFHCYFICTFAVAPPVEELTFSTYNPSQRESNENRICFSPTVLYTLLPDIENRSHTTLPSKGTST